LYQPLFLSQISTATSCSLQPTERAELFAPPPIREQQNNGGDNSGITANISKAFS
jgi:hypothetical protein